MADMFDEKRGIHKVKMDSQHAVLADSAASQVSLGRSANRVGPWSQGGGGVGGGEGVSGVWWHPARRRRNHSHGPIGIRP